MLASTLAAIESDNDRNFIAEIYSKYRAPMYQKALSLLHNSHDAEDAVETAMLKLIDRIELLRGCNRASLRSYLISCAKNAAIDRLRRNFHQYSFDDVQARIEAIPSERDVDAGLLRASQANAMADALLRMPERERELLRMKYYEELSDREIAEVLGIRCGSIRTCLMRARRRLGEILKEAEIDAN